RTLFGNAASIRRQRRSERFMAFSHSSCASAETSSSSDRTRFNKSGVKYFTIAFSLSDADGLFRRRNGQLGDVGLVESAVACMDLPVCAAPPVDRVQPQPRFGGRAVCWP